MLLLAEQEVTNLTLRQDPLLYKILPDRSLSLPLLAEQHVQLEGAYYLVTEQYLAQALSGASESEKPQDFGFGQPVPSLRDFTDARSLSIMPHQSLDKYLPGNNPGIVEKLGKAQIPSGHIFLPKGRCCIEIA